MSNQKLCKYLIFAAVQQRMTQITFHCKYSQGSVDAKKKKKKKKKKGLHILETQNKNILNRGQNICGCSSRRYPY